MIPLSFFLFAWLAFIALYGVMGLVSLFQFLRFGVVGTGTWLSSVTFLTVALLVILGTGGYLLGVDWNQSLDLLGVIGPSSILGS